MDRIYFENVDQAYRILYKAYRHNCPKLIAFCLGCIECMEYDQYLIAVAR